MESECEVCGKEMKVIKIKICESCANDDLELGWDHELWEDGDD